MVTISTTKPNGQAGNQGSGFVVRSDGVIVTNWHVLAGAASASVTLASGETFERVGFLDGDIAADIVLLKVPGYRMPTVDVAGSIPQVGTKIVAIGSPFGLNQTVSEGIVSAVRIVDGKQLVQITAPISPGSSGGAVFDPAGHVFAVSSSYIASGQALNFAVPVKYAMGLLTQTPSERAIKDVFADADSHATTTGAPAASGGASAVPRRSASPRPSVNGTYVLTQDWSVRGEQRLKQTGFLAKSDAVGLMVLADVGADDKFTDRKVYGVRVLRTGSDGDVALDVGGISFSGYQTDTGFYVTADVKGESASAVVRLEAETYSVPISDNSGLYAASVRTRYSAGSFDGGYLDWSGAAAIFVVGGEVHIDLALRNSSGGDTGIFGKATIEADGKFDLVVKNLRLAGVIRSGVLDARWTDRRANGGVFEGMLHAERR